MTDVTQSVYTLLYRLVQRSVGATEIAENDKLMCKTLHIFEKFESSTSLAHIIFPWLVTPNYIIRLIAGARLYMIIMKILKQRKTKRQDDALQYVHDEDGDDAKTVRVSPNPFNSTSGQDAANTRDNQSSFSVLFRRA